MSAPVENPRDLTSWKQIASYLRVTVRTAQKWEHERGLPVQRLPGKRSVVMTTEEELNAWRRSAENGDSEPHGLFHAVAEDLSAPPRARKWHWAALAVPALAMSVWLGLSGTRVPSHWRIDLDTLVVLDDLERVCWKYRFPEPWYSSYRGIPPSVLSHVGDIDGDGRVEVLFTFAGEASHDSGAELFCFDHRGNVKWRFRPGRQVRSDLPESFADAYHIQAIAAFHDPATGSGRIVISSTQIPWYPNQVALLDGTGKLLGEYWHSGALAQMAVEDLDGDGKVEILLGGVSNGYRGATLVILDPAEVSGTSEERAGYQLQGFAAAHERLRLVMPETCLSRLTKDRMGVGKMRIEPDGVTVLVAGEKEGNQAFYHFTRRLALKTVVPTDRFQVLHGELTASRQLDHALTAEEVKKLGEVRYLRGAAWAEAGWKAE